ncbi:MAG TPA: hypothetical protein VJA17_01505 [Candidatus Omnitrophota bacterium]|nr:hypothetical protein [Candidatus Omnitrophota bacterium]
MKLRQKIIIIIFVLLSAGGCARIMEPFRVMWGSSTRALEKARGQAISKTYPCEFNACFDAALEIVKERKYVLFVNERSNKRLVVMGIPGNVDTTEVGIFFHELKKSEVWIDISSLSSTAKERVAKAVFDELDKKFKEQK